VIAQRIDLRSDTVTLPTEAMRRAMAEAELGDDGYHEDPTVNRLETVAAERLGKAAGLFLPSGTMGNLVALLAHGNRGSVVLLDQRSHILRIELGGMAIAGSMFPFGLPGFRGQIDLEALALALSSSGPRRLGTAIVTVENTHNDSGGAVLPVSHLAEVAALAQKSQAPVHMDGARLFNAAAALGITAAEIAQYADSVTFCLSKGLSAPVGAVLVGDQSFIERARMHRKLLGGGMRQAGVLAAAGLVALETMTERLVQDHACARSLASRLARFDSALSAPASVESNIVMFDISVSRRSAEWWSGALRLQGVLVNASGPTRLRFVIHRHIGLPEVDKAASIVERIW